MRLASAERSGPHDGNRRRVTKGVEVKIPKWLHRRLADFAARVAQQSEPDETIGAKDPRGPYLERWWIVRSRFTCIYIHRFMRSDDDRALHDHPWIGNLSILLGGSYVEHEILYGGVHTKTTFEERDVKLRGPWFAHRIEISGPAWTLFITGPRVRQWGFFCPQGWRHWQDFTSATDGKTEIGRGCD